MKSILSLILLFSSFSVLSLEGLKVNESVPSIELRDSDNRNFKFNNLREKTVFVFFRGSWCPYCLKQLKDLNKNLVSNLNGAQLVAVSTDKVSVAKRMKKKLGLDFTVLSDPHAKALQAFKIVNKLNDSLVKKYKDSYQIDVEADSGQTHHMIAHPGVFIVDKESKVLFADVQTDYKKRTKVESIIKALQ